MKKIFFLVSLVLLLNGCAQTMALLGSTAGGVSNGKVIQSSLRSSISYGVKKQTGKTPLGHVLTYAEKNNPGRKKETCISFIEKTRSEFCTIAKKKISLSQRIIKEKVFKKVEEKPETTTINPIKKIPIKPGNKIALQNEISVNSFNETIKSTRELAIAFQRELKKKLKSKYVSQSLISR